MQLVSGCSFNEAFPPFARGFIAVQPGTMHSLPPSFPPANVYKGIFPLARPESCTNHCNCCNMATESLEG